MGLETLAAAASIIGTGLSVAGAETAKSRMNSAANAELERQAQFQKQSTALFRQSLGQSTPQAAQTQLGQGQTAAQAELAKVAQQPLGLAMPTQQQTGNVVGTKEQGARSKLMTQAVAPNLGYSEYGLQQSIQNLLNQQRLALIGQQSGMSAGVLPIELAQAQQSGSTLSGIGSLLSTAGYLGGMYGATRLPKRNPYTDPEFARTNPVYGVQ